MVLGLVQQVYQRLYHPFFSFARQRHLGRDSLAFLTCAHKVFVRAQVGKGDRSMLYGVFLEPALDGFEKECGDFLFDKFVTKFFVKTQICEVATALSMMFHVLCVFEHVYHEVNHVVSRHLLVAVEDLSDVSEGCRRVQSCLKVAR